MAKEPKYKSALAQEWAGPIMAALELNAAKLGTPEGSLSDFIRLIKMSRELLEVDEPPPTRTVVWVDGWHTERDFLNLEDADDEEDDDDYDEPDDYDD